MGRILYQYRLSLLFGDENVIEFKMPLNEVEQNLLSIISVTDRRVAGYSQYDKDVFPGEQFTAILGLSDSLKANSRMLNFFSDLLRSQIPEDTINPKKNSPALLAKAFMDTHYTEPIKMQDVAASLNIHPNYLCAVFKKTYGQTPSDYLRSIRMSQASMLLDLTDYSVSMIAGSLGYANPFQFSAAFKSYYGMPLTGRRCKHLYLLQLYEFCKSRQQQTDLPIFPGIYYPLSLQPLTVYREQF